MRQKNVLTRAKFPRVCAIAMATVGTIMLPVSSAQAATLEISMTNISPTGGIGFSPIWFGLHDGSFDIFNEGEAASDALKIIAEDGMTGLETTVPDYIEATSVPPFNGFDFDGFIGNQPTLGSTFTGAFQSLLYDIAIGIAPGGTGTRTVSFDDSEIPEHRFFSYQSKFMKLRFLVLT